MYSFRHSGFLKSTQTTNSKEHKSKEMQPRQLANNILPFLSAKHCQNVLTQRSTHRQHPCSQHNPQKSTPRRTPTTRPPTHANPDRHPRRNHKYPTLPLPTIRLPLSHDDHTQHMPRLQPHTTPPKIINNHMPRLRQTNQNKKYLVPKLQNWRPLPLQLIPIKMEAPHRQTTQPDATQTSHHAATDTIPLVAMKRSGALSYCTVNFLSRSCDIDF